jgi:hypothetical protein
MYTSPKTLFNPKQHMKTRPGLSSCDILPLASITQENHSPMIVHFWHACTPCLAVVIICESHLASCLQQEAPKQRQATAGVNPMYGHGEDGSDPTEPASDAPTSHAAPAAVLWWPQASAEKQQQLLRLWSAGVRLPEQIPEPPTADALQQAERGVREHDEGVVVGPAWPVQHQQQYGVHPVALVGPYEQQPQVAGYAPQEGHLMQSAEGSMQSQIMLMQPSYGGWANYEVWYPAQQ